MKIDYYILGTVIYVISSGFALFGAGTGNKPMVLFGGIGLFIGSSIIIFLVTNQYNKEKGIK